MTQPLTPAAQAVLIAFRMAPSDRDEPCVAAALRAAADQVVPANGSRKNNEIRSEILAIAAELEGGR